MPEWFARVRAGWRFDGQGKSGYNRVVEEQTTAEHTPSVYIPMDRRQALARGGSLPDRTSGAALFADISGFTPLTEALVRTLGPRIGAEELTRQLNRVYDALITEVDRYGGSVIGFAGDAITCWFADQDLTGSVESVRSVSFGASLRATACALAMQQAMAPFGVVELSFGETVSLAMKAAVASGPARRLLVGDPSIQLMDALAGETLARMAAGEHLANRGEVLVDVRTVEHLEEQGRVLEWRTDAETGARFAVVGELAGPVEPAPWQTLAPAALQEEQVRRWLLPAVYERLREGLGEILVELRPGVVTLFLSFAGIDYEGDEEAQTKLDRFIRWVQGLLARYEGSLLQLIIGDKGSYLYASFGAPVAHEDDPRRAVLAALELRTPPADLGFIESIQIGISQGRMRTGAYGGMTRRTYGVLGDEVNLAARLMQQAGPGEVLASRRVEQAAGGAFNWEVLPAIRVKGKSAPVPVARLVGMSRARARAESTVYTGKMVGREEEMAQLLESLRPLFAEGDTRFPGMVCVYGEAGVGKSRLVYELRQRLASPVPQIPGPKWFICPAEQILRPSLYPFKYFLREYFDQYAESSEQENKARFGEILDGLISDLETVEGVPALEVSEIKRELERTRSMLGALVDLRWEGSLYEQLEPRLRFENSLAAFKTLVRAESLRQPVVLHVEDAHWLDADSEELLRVLTRNVEAYPLAVLLTGRYRDDGSRYEVDVDEQVPRRVIDLNELPPAGIQALAGQALAGEISNDLATFLEEKTNGNPLFIEQLALDLRERGFIRLEDGKWQVRSEDVEAVPASISAVLIARLDRLAAQVKVAVQTAAVLGREFEVQVLSRILQDDDQLLAKVRQAEAELVWSALSELRYIFRHTLMRDAAYDMQLQARLERLHALAGWAIEEMYAEDLGPHYGDLAYHYGKAGDTEREYRYARLAGEHAAAQYANQEAIGYFNQALRSIALLDTDETGEQRLVIYTALGELLTTIGQYDQALDHLNEAHLLSLWLGDREAQARACRWVAQTYEQLGEYPPALEWIEQGLIALGSDDPDDRAETAEAAELSLIAGFIHTRQGYYDDALEQCQRALDIADELSKVPSLARAYNLLGHVARLRGQMTTAIEHFQRALDLYEQAGDIRGRALAHNMLAVAYDNVGQWQEAERYYHQAREIFEQMGDVYNRAFVDNNLGEIARTQGRLEEALTSYQAGLRAAEQIGGSLWVLGGFHNNLGATFIRRGEIDAAREHLRISQDYFERAQARDWLPELYCHWAEAALYVKELVEAQAQAEKALGLARELEMRPEEGTALRILGEVATAQGQFDRAEEHIDRSLEILESVGDEYRLARSQLSLAELHIAQGKPMAARVALEQCIPAFERLEAALDLSTARELWEEAV
jgi:class 3 adenylate cyclase/tetratricopeptide (TPR) repeat protein